jgi:hypothetical protein
LQAGSNEANPTRQAPIAARTRQKTSGLKGGNNKVGSRPPVYFAEYDCDPAALPEAAETFTAQQYLLDYTPETA